MTPEELKAAYALAERPYVEAPGPTPQHMLGLRSWRYVLEINSVCNLKCALCHAGNRGGYEYTPGVMDMALFENILDKIVTENPSAVVCAYVNSEPFLHPHLAQCIASIKRRGLRCEIATNGNIIRNINDVLAAKPDLLTVSVSGWTQPIYERSHRGGDIETVKRHIVEIAEANSKGGHKVHLGVSYHMYEYNLGEELNQMKAFTESLGLQFLLSWGRAICIENTVQALRELQRRKDGSIHPYENGPGNLDMNVLLPPASEEFIKSMEQLRFHPKKAMKLYEQWPVASVCPIADVFTEIRWDGRVQLCAWTDDMRLTIGNFMEMNHYQRTDARLGHPLCQECLRYRLPLYFHLVECTKFDSMNTVE